MATLVYKLVRAGSIFERGWDGLPTKIWLEEERLSIQYGIGELKYKRGQITRPQIQNSGIFYFKEIQYAIDYLQQKVDHSTVAEIWEAEASETFDPPLKLPYGYDPIEFWMNQDQYWIKQVEGLRAWNIKGEPLYTPVPSGTMLAADLTILNRLSVWVTEPKYPQPFGFSGLYWFREWDPAKLASLNLVTRGSRRTGRRRARKDDDQSTQE